MALLSISFLSTGINFFAFTKQLVNTCHVPGTALGVRNTAINEMPTGPLRDSLAENTDK